MRSKFEFDANRIARGYKVAQEYQVVYSPLWQFNCVVMPRDYQPNGLRSEADCLWSGYALEKSTIVEN